MTEPDLADDQASSRPTLLERRRAATELEIALVAVELFTANGVAQTTVEDIAGGAGVSVRTFYRYFRSKQQAVTPLLRAAAAAWQRQLRSRAASAHLAEAGAATAIQAVRAAIRAALESMRTTISAPMADGIRGLLRAARSDAELAEAWDAVNGESERQLRPVLARLAGAPEHTRRVRLLAAIAADAVRIALETWAESGDANTTVAAEAEAVLDALAAGLLAGELEPARAGGAGA